MSFLHVFCHGAEVIAWDLRKSVTCFLACMFVSVLFTKKPLEF